MPTFIYKVISKNGGVETGSLEASSSYAAGRLLKERGLTVTEIAEANKSNWLDKLGSIGTIPLKEKIAFIQNLDLLLRSGVSAPRAMRIISDQTANKKFKNIVKEMAGNVEAGKAIHEAMQAYPKVFSHIFTSMVEVGEISGNLEKSLEYLRVQLQREADLKSKTKGAMIYPGVILSAMVIIGVLLAIFVLPKLTETFKDFGGELPLLTRMTIIVSDFMAANSVLVIGGLVALVIFGVYGLRTKSGKRYLAWTLLNLPMIKEIVKKINIARFSRILGSLMKSGVSVVEGLRVTGEALDNVYYQDAVAATAEQVKLGKPLTDSLAQNSKLYPFIITQMLSIGEETGNLEKILDQIAEHYEVEIDDTMKNLSSIIEPILLLIIGVVVGFLALALIMPIYNISQSIQ